MGSWGSLDFQDFVLDILAEVGFYAEKKYKRSLYSLCLQHGDFKVPIFLYIHYHSESELSIDDIKDFYIQYKSQSEQHYTKSWIISNQPIHSDVAILAKTLNIDLMRKEDVFYMLFDQKSYLSYINRFAIHSIVPKYLVGLKSYRYHLKDIVLKYEDFPATILIEGLPGGGRSGFLKTLIYSLFQQYPHHFFFYIDFTFILSHDSFEDFLFHESFIKNNILIRSQKIFTLLLESGNVTFIFDNCEVINSLSILQQHYIWDYLSTFNQKGIRAILMGEKSQFFYQNNQNFSLNQTIKQLKMKKMKGFVLEEMNQSDIKNYSQFLNDTDLLHFPLLRYLLSIPSILLIFNQMGGKYNIEHLKDFSYFISQVANLWETFCFTEMGKEVVLEYIAMKVHQNGSFTLDQESLDRFLHFLSIEYQMSDNIEHLVEKDIENNPFLKIMGTKQFVFCNRSVRDMFLAIQLKNEFSRGNYRNTLFLGQEIVFNILKLLLGEDKLITIVLSECEKNINNHHYFYLLLTLHNQNKSQIFQEGLFSTSCFYDNTFTQLSLINRELVDFKWENCQIMDSDFSYIKLSSLRFNNINFSNSKMTHSFLFNSYFQHTNFVSIDLSKGYWQEGWLESVEFQKSSLMYSIWKQITIHHIKFIHCQMDYFKIDNSDIDTLMLSDAQGQLLSFFGSKMTHFSICNYQSYRMNLSETILYDFNVLQVEFENLLLRKVLCQQSKFLNVQFLSSSLYGSVFEDTHFENVRFYFSDLRNIQFIRCNFVQTEFEEIDCRHMDFKGCSFDHDTENYIKGLKFA